jgi:cytoskeletal protein RodZ
MDMDEDGETKTWLIALKLLLIAAALIGAVGLALWYASQLPESSPALEAAQQEVHEKKSSASTSSSSSKSWGIAKDSPIRK